MKKYMFMGMVLGLLILSILFSFLEPNLGELEESTARARLFEHGPRLPFGGYAVPVALEAYLDITNIRKGIRYQSIAVAEQKESKDFLAKLVAQNETIGSVSLVEWKGNKYFITAFHCWDRVVKLRTDFSIIIQGKIFHYKTGDQSIYKDREADIAIIPAPNSLNTRLRLGVNLPYQNGAAVTLYGFPFSDFFFSQGKIIPIDTNAPWKRPTDINVDCLAGPGASGGPIVYRSHGKLWLYGIVTDIARPLPLVSSTAVIGNGRYTIGTAYWAIIAFIERMQKNRY